ncbi:MAG: FprA family A-type flavoprotein [Actinobacteria bacterium]|nr:FprA family A-type flavoprotein [Actinomycetota bacterium]MCG2817889.1 FprA family A-type flavoprotein [Actinomycetes bacterium]MBU4178647.1 FprA family A-type flavoprotein [Actinomycetota bacterium]MBU4219774.1 FprA family A-type flavoprotein [Actinomycetota bacterium]MBU4357818.1 FprA family A-type flavoprotein [Actinomycetota bacterium]
MPAPFEAVKVSEHVYWVGAIDWGIRDFHGYSTSRGSTYNAYLIVADDIILVDTVKAPFKDELLSRVASVVDPHDIRYVISLHSEMDHTGSLPQVLREVEPEKVFASRMGVKALTDHFHMDREIIAVGDGDILALGGVDLTFLETRMLHWPDSMVAYLARDHLLFSQDGFGMHLAASERFADEIPDSVLVEEGERYFANILLPFSPLVLKLLERVSNLGVEIDIIAPDHGPIWREDLGKILGLYSKWATQEPANKAVVVFDTMWGSTEKMAGAIGEAMTRGGLKVVLLPLKSSHRSDVAAQLLGAGALLVGTPTINNMMFPTVADVLTYLEGLKPKNLVGAAFGSYGWSGEGAKLVGEALDRMDVEQVRDPVRVKYVPDDEALEACGDLGAAVAKRMKEVANE